MELRALLLPTGVAADAAPLLAGRALRAFADGYVVILLPAYLLALGFGVWEVGVLSSATLLGSALLTLAVGAFSQLVAPWLAQRIGLLNTMVFTHTPANCASPPRPLHPACRWR